MEVFHQYYKKLLLHVSWANEKKLFRFLQRQETLIFSSTFKLALNPTLLPIYWVGVGHFPGVQRPGREPEYSYWSTVKVKNKLYVSPSTCIQSVHRDKC